MSDIRKDRFREERLLGSLLNDNTGRSAMDEVAPILRPEDFRVAGLRKVFAAMHQLYGDGNPINYSTVFETINNNGNGMAELAKDVSLLDLMDGAVGSSQAAFFARRIRKSSDRRRLVDTAGEIIKDAEDDGIPTSELLDKAEKAILDISGTANSHEFIEVGDALDDVFAEIETAFKLKRPPGLLTGFKSLDDKLGGMQGGDFIIIGGRPSMGKTTLALNITAQVASKGTPVGFFSLETSAKKITMRLISSISRVPLKNLKSGRLSDDDWIRIANVTGILHEKLKIIIDDKSRLSPLELKAKAHRMKSKHDVGLICVDYLQLMHHSSAWSQEHEVSVVSGVVKSLAKELDIPIIGISQLNRESERGNETRPPRLNNLRYSGALEQDADVVAFVYRPEYYDIKRTKDGRDTTNLAQIIFAKNRDGERGTVNMNFFGDILRFEDRISERGAVK